MTRLGLCCLGALWPVLAVGFGPSAMAGPQNRWHPDPAPGFTMVSARAERPDSRATDARALDARTLDRSRGEGETVRSPDVRGQGVAVILWDEAGRPGTASVRSTAGGANSMAGAGGR